MKKSEPNYPIKVLNKSLSILQTLLQQELPMNMTEISKKLGFYPSVTHRILDTLKNWGYVEQESDTKKYKLGLKVLELGMAKLHQMDLVREATPYLKELVKQCNETVHLGVLEEGEVLYLAKEESSQTIRMISYVGKRAPLHCTALGKVLLAHLSTEERKKTLGEKVLSCLTENLKVVHNLEKGMPPQIDLLKEQAVQNTCREAIRKELVSSAHDCSEGGLAITLAESCIKGKKGARIKIKNKMRSDALLFGESQSRIIVSINPKNLPLLQDIADKYQVPLLLLGSVEGEKLNINRLINLKVDQLEKVWRGKK